MENSSEKKPIEQKVLAAINSGEVKMRPKWFFILRGALFASGAFLVFVTLLYLLSFDIFVLRQTGVLVAPGFGLRGWSEFFLAMPWIILLFIAIFLIILEILVRQYKFAYRWPLLYSLLFIFFLVVCGSLAVERTQLHRRLADFAENDQLPVAGRLYRDCCGARIKNIHRGMVENVFSDGFNMRSRHREIFRVIINSETRMPSGGNFSRGNIVVVFGPEENNVIQAIGIQHVSD